MHLKKKGSLPGFFKSLGHGSTGFGYFFAFAGFSSYPNRSSHRVRPDLITIVSISNLGLGLDNLTV